MTPTQYGTTLVWSDEPNQYRTTERAVPPQPSEDMDHTYLEEILQHEAHMEELTLPDVDRIDSQPEIQWYMRRCLVDFLIAAHSKLCLLPETLFRAVNLVDRYCSKRVVYKKHYKLLGCTALLIAAKYSKGNHAEETTSIPQISTLEKMCFHVYDRDLFIKMEKHILDTLDWTIGYPTVHRFFELHKENEEHDQEVEHMSAYFCEIALYHRDFVSTKPSLMCRASLLLSRAILRRNQADGGGGHDLENHTSNILQRHLGEPSPHVKYKYSGVEFSGVAHKVAHFMASHAAAHDHSTESSALCAEESDKEVTGFDSARQQCIGGLFHPFPTPPGTPRSGY